ncbi:MAG: hypothetical protein DMD72_03565 [Gemmatimonadetes bacterium]|nr:MAG: hypothetical protein DMD72_03565 [Gemmatimonadota bacterium]
MSAQVLHHGTGGFPLFQSTVATMMTKTMPNRIPSLMAPPKDVVFLSHYCHFSITPRGAWLLAHDY